MLRARAVVEPSGADREPSEDTRDLLDRLAKVSVSPETPSTGEKGLAEKGLGE